MENFDQLKLSDFRKPIYEITKCIIIQGVNLIENECQTHVLVMAVVRIIRPVNGINLLSRSLIQLFKIMILLFTIKMLVRMNHYLNWTWRFMNSQQEVKGVTMRESKFSFDTQVLNIRYKRRRLCM